MATGWAKEGAVTEQIDASISEAVARARLALGSGPSLSHCVECGEEIPAGRRHVLPGVRLCVPCQQMLEAGTGAVGSLNRRGSKDSQLR